MMLQMSMPKKVLLATVVLTYTVLASEQGISFGYFSDVHIEGNIRSRYSHVHTGNSVGDANALTNRFRLDIASRLQDMKEVSVYLEAINVSGWGDYWDVSHKDIADKPRYNIVADPSQTRITQAYVDYASSKTLLRIGRQGFNMDNQRFVGTVNWRQMPQTYDAVSLQYTSLSGLSLFGACLWRVHTVFDKDTVKSTGESYSTHTIILHTTYRYSKALTLGIYDYMLEDRHDTYGMFAKGNIALNRDTMLSYRAEYAVQTDPFLYTQPVHITADAVYSNIETTLHYHRFFIGAGYELLGAGKGGNQAFGTPLATLHAQNGWADIFLNTPVDGLVDSSVILGYKAKGFGVVKMIYHEFDSDRGNISYGTETDIMYKTKISVFKGVSAMLKASFYHADTYRVDTTKYWAMLNYTF